MPLAASITIRVLAGIVLAVLLSVMGVLVLNRKSRAVVSYSPLFCIISLSGLVLAMVSAILMVDSSGDPVVCTVATWLVNVGFTLAFAAVWAKTFRLWRIFGNPLLQMLSIGNGQLLSVILAFVVVDVVVLAVWIAVAPYSSSSLSDQYITCVSSQSDVFDGILVALKGLWIVSGSWLVHRIRSLSLPPKFNESEALTLVIYNMAFIGSATIAIWFGLRGSIGANGISILLAIAVIIAVSTFAVLLFFPIVKQLRYKDKAKRFSTLKHSHRHSASPKHFSAAKDDAAGSDRKDSGSGAGQSVHVGGQLESNDAVHLALRLSKEFEKFMAEIQGKSSIHAIEQKILETYSRLKVTRRKVLQGYSSYQQDLVSIAQLNADLFYLKQTGTLQSASRSSAIEQNQKRQSLSQQQRPCAGTKDEGPGTTAITDGQRQGEAHVDNDQTAQMEAEKFRPLSPSTQSGHGHGHEHKRARSPSGLDSQFVAQASNRRNSLEVSNNTPTITTTSAVDTKGPLRPRIPSQAISLQSASVNIDQLDQQAVDIALSPPRDDQ